MYISSIKVVLINYTMSSFRFRKYSIPILPFFYHTYSIVFHCAKIKQSSN